MIGRRGFFAQVAGLGAAIAAPALAKGQPVPEWPTAAQPERYREYDLFWSGWIPEGQSDRLVGQWLAYPAMRPYDHHKHPPFLYVIAPGFIGGPYLPGHVFNLSSPKRIVTFETSAEQRAAWTTEGHRYLRQLVDEFHPQRADEVSYGAIPRRPGEWNG